MLQKRNDQGVRQCWPAGLLGGIVLLALGGQLLIQQRLMPQLLGLNGSILGLLGGLQALRLILFLITTLALGLSFVQLVPGPTRQGADPVRGFVSRAETQALLQALTLEQEKSEQLLLNILPAPIAHRLKHEPRPIAEGYNEVTVMFADIVGFTPLSSQMSPKKLVYLLNLIFSAFDRLVEQHQLEKIKTMGDAYMVAGGLPETRSDHAGAMVELAIAMQRAIAEIAQETGEDLRLRVGIHTGPVVAGVIGIKKFSYDLWGDTVNIASRMESQGIDGGIQVSQRTQRLLMRDESKRFAVRALGDTPIKGKGEMKTYEILAFATEPRISAGL